ncbi:25.3 kDa vesicle transport protein SEC22-1 isoform X2 [Vitis vinifera]|uniref:25.3 kDa vesicle transport protein SEC22-1 isoform X2 n=1 Tax=Vitis vinifera TaxID=29760 RepID=UPI00053FF9FD|nr:25.3 kDa vesicle transport protein SEC22-1 isoform X2 [Vitis vinifera]|eukprot:XP_010662773.1 PREDICTED: 25.3 kDa vesicle transport protein isoform X2 [Vitis vinifera]
MVKLTIVGRVSDGLPLAQGLRYQNDEENENFLCYKQQAEFILKEISRGALSPSKMTIHIDHYHCFNYLVENGHCFITLCDSSYPRKLAFHYLQDLQKEFEKFDIGLMEKITKPYSFVRFDGIIGNIRKQYIDTRTQANLSKLNANRGQDLDIIAKHMSEIIQKGPKSGHCFEMDSHHPHCSCCCYSIMGQLNPYRELQLRVHKIAETLGFTTTKDDTTICHGACL